MKHFWKHQSKEPTQPSVQVVVGSGVRDAAHVRIAEQFRHTLRKVWGIERYRIAAIAGIICLVFAAGGLAVFAKLSDQASPVTSDNAPQAAEKPAAKAAGPASAGQDEKPADDTKTDQSKTDTASPASSGTTGGSSNGSTGSSGGGNSSAPSGWPGASNTGVPAGTVLGSYTGCSGGETLITTANTVIDAKQVNCDVIIRATGVVIKNSLINGTVNTDEDQPGSFSITDSEVTGGMGTKNFTALRVNVHGGIGPNVYCYTNCDIRDSWLHTPAFPADNPEAHLGAFLANDNGPNGSTTSVTLIHNTIHCDTPPSPQDGGCSGDINLFGDFGPISHVTIDGNWLGGSSGISYCFYGGDSPTKPYPNASYVVFKNNVFQKGATGQCGAYGPVSSFNSSGTGNIWSNNKYDDGATVNAAN